MFFFFFLILWPRNPVAELEIIKTEKMEQLSDGVQVERTEPEAEQGLAVKIEWKDLLPLMLQSTDFTVDEPNHPVTPS